MHNIYVYFWPAPLNRLGFCPWYIGGVLEDEMKLEIELHQKVKFDYRNALGSILCSFETDLSFWRYILSPFPCRILDIPAAPMVTHSMSRSIFRTLPKAQAMVIG